MMAGVNIVPIPYKGTVPAVLALMRGEAGGAAGRLQEIPGMVPPLTNLPQGCAFAPRCAFADETCRTQYPLYEAKRPGHWAACWHSDRLAGAVDA